MLPTPDAFILQFDKALRTVFAKAGSRRPYPDAGLPDAELSEADKHHAAGLMRINHSGEVCAQALYAGQALTARNPEAQRALLEAADEETEHLAWCEKRLDELGSHKSFLNPLWYAGSFALGACAGALGDRWNLGFLAETERQVEGHLDSHLSSRSPGRPKNDLAPSGGGSGGFSEPGALIGQSGSLPEQDAKSRAIVEQMKIDEAKHADTAIAHGGAPLPAPVRGAMQLTSKVLTHIAYRI